MFSSRERWIMLIASAWLVTGLQLDAYAHATTPELETFWTPWHAVLYSGIAVSGLTLVWLLRPRLPAIPTYQTVLALPNALRIPLAGTTCTKAEVTVTVGRQPASACGTFSSTERSWARAVSSVGLLL